MDGEDNLLEKLIDGIKENLEEVKGYLKKISIETDENKRTKLKNRAEKLLNTTRENQGMCSEELKNFQGEKTKYEETLNKYKKKIDEYAREIETCLSTSKKKDLLGAKNDDDKNKQSGNNPVNEDRPKEDDPPEENVIQQTKMAKKGDVTKLDQTIEMQEDINRRLDNMNQMADTTIDMGIDINVELKRQTEQMEKIQKDLDKMGTGVKRAFRELRGFMLKLACDWIVLIVGIIIIILIIIVIIIRIVVPQLFDPMFYMKTFGKSDGPRNLPSTWFCALLVMVFLMFL